MGHRIVWFVTALLLLVFAGGSVGATCPCIHEPCEIQSCEPGEPAADYIGLNVRYGQGSDTQSNFGQWTAFTQGKSLKATLGDYIDLDEDEEEDDGLQITFELDGELELPEGGGIEIVVGMAIYELVNGEWVFDEWATPPTVALTASAYESEGSCMLLNNDTGCTLASSSTECAAADCWLSRWCSQPSPGHCLFASTGCMNPLGPTSCACWNYTLVCSGSGGGWEMGFLEYLLCKAMTGGSSTRKCVVDVVGRDVDFM